MRHEIYFIDVNEDDREEIQKILFGKPSRGVEFAITFQNACTGAQNNSKPAAIASESKEFSSIPASTGQTFPLLVTNPALFTGPPLVASNLQTIVDGQIQHPRMTMMYQHPAYQFYQHLIAKQFDTSPHMFPPLGYTFQNAINSGPTSPQLPSGFIMMPPHFPVPPPQIPVSMLMADQGQMQPAAVIGSSNELPEMAQTPTASVEHSGSNGEQNQPFLNTEIQQEVIETNVQLSPDYSQNVSLTKTVAVDVNILAEGPNHTNDQTGSAPMDDLSIGVQNQTDNVPHDTVSTSPNIVSPPTENTAMNESQKLDNGQEPSKQKTWASLFQDSASKAIVTKIVEETYDVQDEDPALQVALSNSMADVTFQHASYQINRPEFSPVMENDIVSVDQDPYARHLAKMLKEYGLVNRSPTFALQGIKNIGNWCYVNATLQALMACPTFFHFLRFLSRHVPQRKPTSTPLLDAFTKFASEFNLTNDMNRPSSNQRQSLNQARVLDPAYMRNIISHLKTDATFKGRQEDAEELLLFVLNRLHEELVAAASFLDKEKPGQRSRTVSTEIAESNNNQQNNEWQQVGPGRKLAITRQIRNAQSPISQIFSGQLRYGLCQPGAKESAILEPFFTLPLDVQSVNDITSALQAFTSKEILKNYQGKDNAEVDATRRVTFYELPPVLIFQLKYFVYADDCLKKITKRIEYSMDLKIDPSILSNRNSDQRQYKLFAVVFHHGEKAEGGHYTVDVFNGGQWIHIDDTKVTPVKHDHVLSYQPPRVPYLLFYRRMEQQKIHNYGQRYANNAVGSKDT